MPDVATETIGNLVGAIRKESPAGFATALHIRFTSPTFLFVGYPKAWSEEYTERSLHMQDPSVVWGFTHTGWIRWSELEANDPAGVISGARRHGMTFGLAWTLLRGDTRSVAGFSRGDRDFTAAEIDRLGELLAQLHDATAGTDELPERAVLALRAMSVRLTHV